MFPSSENNGTARSILCIPGNWESFEAFKDALIVASDASYMVVGDMLISGTRKRHFTFEFCERDERMPQAFAAAGKVTRMSPGCIDQVAQHRFVIYISGDTGSLEEATEIALAGNAILQAGGTAIKVESTGKAFEKAYWTDLLTEFVPSRLYEMFVIDSIIDEDGTVYSCGMQNLGFKDTIVSGQPFQAAVDLIKIFGYYQVVENPVIQHNQTFRANMESPVFIIVEEPDQPYNESEIFHNPFGMWRLELA